ncbi:MAG: hypothetical protein IPN14_06515 [Bacteroidetes bacterium]|jgi:hypothetical protein|nr:hypothetical protein [Bacteroidota bacterium]MBK9300255.1 hypothetical protein [Bacteroidota bacterium]MBK9482852.1 hypothetical protein [Bacteroidota bacterium]
MANKSNSSKNFFENMLETQQQVMDTLVENTKKLTNGNTLINETIDKGTEMYKKTVDATKETLDKVTGTANTAKEEVKNTTEKANEYFANWFNQQNDWTKQMTEMNKNFLSGFTNGSNPFQQFMNTASQNPMQQFANMFNQNPMQQFTSMMNPSSMQEQMDKATEQAKAFYNQFQSILNNNYSEFTKNLQNGTLMDSYKGMFNMTDGFSKFYEMWMPMMKSMNDKTFNMDVFSKNMDMSKYKEFMDKYFSFMPQQSQDYINKMKEMYTDAMKNGGNQAKEMFSNMKNSMQNVMPSMFGNPFSNMLSNYNSMQGQMMNAVTPFAKLMTPSNDTKTMNEWAEIMNNVNIYNIKNAELQHMIYQNGTKVMEKIAENVMHKIENGEDINSMIKLYQEWLNTSDKMFVDLFETDEYSKLMAEVSSLQLRIKKAVEKQTEKMFENVPVATRSEMDEVYQTIYDLKKQVRQLQSMLEVEIEVPSEKETTAKSTAKKASAKK